MGCRTNSASIFTYYCYPDKERKGLCDAYCLQICMSVNTEEAVDEIRWYCLGRQTRTI